MFVIETQHEVFPSAGLLDSVNCSLGDGYDGDDTKITARLSI